MPDRKDLAGREAGNYRLIQRIGSGSFAEVYLGEHIYLRSPAAIKLLHAALDPAAAANFRREARILRKLRHPNIISLLDFGVDEQGLPYLIMDYAPGGSLRSRYPKGMRVPLDAILKAVNEAASALDYAHNQGFVHRDIKPANMLIGESGEILVSDFGIASIAPGRDPHASDDSLWRRSFPGVAGTPAYMAPEQLEGRAEPASDQYALATIVYQWLCGALPFDGKSWMEIAARRASSDPPPLRDFNPAISTELEDVVLTGLARNPRHRYASVRAFAAALIEAAQHPPAVDARLIAPIAGSPSTPTIPINRASTANRAAQQVPRVDARPAMPVPPRATQHTPGADARLIAPSRPPVGAQLIDPPTDQTKAPPAPTLLLGRRTILAGMGAVIVAAGAGFALTHLGPRSPVLSHASAKNLHTPGAPHPMTTPTPQAQGTTPAAVDVGTTLYEFHGHAKNVLALAWGPKGNLIASGSLDQTVKIWHALTGSIVTNYTGHTAAVNAVAWAPDGSLIASGGDDKQVQIWNAATGSLIRLYAGHQDIVSAVAWSPDGTLIASGSFDKTVQVWNASTGALIRSYTGHQDVVNTVAWSPDGRYIASGSSDKTVQVWEAATGQLFNTYTKHTDFVSSVLWSLDGKRIASASDDKTVQVWDALDGANGYTYQGHKGAVFVIALSPDGTQIASGSSDKTVQLWNFANGDQIYTYSRPTGAVNALAWSPAGRQIASGGNDKIVLVWQSM